MKTEIAESNEAHFSIKAISSDLNRLSIRGGLSTFVGQFIKFILNLISTAVLARILSPKDFGIIAMVTAVTGFIMIFKDLGLSMATVQRAEINQDQISTLFWINIAISCLLTLITLTISPLIAWFYNKPELLWITAALSIAFIFGGLTVQHQALLRRQMRFAILASIDVLSLLIGVIAAIVSAFFGLGYWSLVVMQLCISFTNACAVWLICDWRPGLPKKQSGIRPMIAFGGYLTIFSIVNYFARNLDNILLGRFWGPQPLGIYSKSYSLLLLPIGQVVAPLTSVVVPALSRLQNDRGSYKRYYLKALLLLSYIAFPLVISMFVLSEEIVILILGDKWLGAIPIFRILAITALFQPIVSTVGWIYVSLGRTRLMAYWGVIACSVIMLSFIVGLPWGPLGIAISYATCTIFLIHPQLLVATRNSPVSYNDIYRTILKPLVFAICIGMGMICARYFFSFSQPILTTVIAILGGCIACIFTLAISKEIQADFKEFFSLLPSLLNHV